MKKVFLIITVILLIAAVSLMGACQIPKSNHIKVKQKIDGLFQLNLHELSLELLPSSDGTYSAEQSAEIWRCLYFCETMLDYTSYADDEKLDKIMYRLYSWYQLDVLSERIDSELVDAMVGMTVNLEVPEYVDRVYDMLFAEE